MNKEFGPKYFLMNVIDNETVIIAALHGMHLAWISPDGNYVMTQVAIDVAQYGVDDVV